MMHPFMHKVSKKLTGTCGEDGAYRQNPLRQSSSIIEKKQTIKKLAIHNRRLNHQHLAA